MKEMWYFGYGSLIFDPLYKGSKLENWCETSIDGFINFGIEFLHSSKNRGGAPTLCFNGAGKTKGKCWRAIGEENIKNAECYLRNREGNIKLFDVELNGVGKVQAWCGDTNPDLKNKTAKEIAFLAVASEKIVSPGRGGVIYIKKCKEYGIQTPMINEIIKEISYIFKL